MYERKSSDKLACSIALLADKFDAIFICARKDNETKKTKSKSFEYSAEAEKSNIENVTA